MAPIIFHVQSLYKEIYQIGSRLPKRDKLGIQAEIEGVCINSLKLSIKASLESATEKQKTIRILRINLETIKHLIRTQLELNIIKERTYISVQEKLQEISKEANGWERYTNKSSLQREPL